MISIGRSISSIIVGTSILISSVHSWAPSNSHQLFTSHNRVISSDPSSSSSSFRTALHAFETKDKATTTTTSADRTTEEETTEQYGLEAGLFQSLKNKDGGQSAKGLLAKYGVAYLATSIPLALVSFAICYGLVDAGVDIASLLGKIGIEVNDNSEKVGTFALAYAAHKAASPIRFPPTVLLTPVVAKLIGKEPEEGEEAV